MSLNNLGFPFDATNSWNGYNHQGKIALWYAITKINEFWNSTKSIADNKYELQKYYLELEYLEDFSILFADNDDKKYNTIHQVKSRQDTDINKYQEAILNLVVKLIKYPSIEHAYLHVTRNLNLGGKSFEENVIQIATQSSKLIELREYIKNHQTEESFRKQFYSPKQGAPSNQKKAVLEALHQSNPDEKKITESNIDVAFQAFLEQSAESINELHEKGAAQAKKVTLFEYSDIIDGPEKQNFCGAEQAEKLLMSAISHYFETTDPTGWRTSDEDYQKKVYLFVLGQLDRHIIERQVNYADYKSNKKDRAISFSEVIGWLETDCSRFGESFYLFHLKENYINKMDGFCAGCKTKPTTCEQCNLNATKDKIIAMTFDDFRKFAFVTSPNVVGSIGMDNYASFAGNSGLTNPFSKGLRDLPASNKNEQKTISTAYIDGNKKQYTLTTIIDDGRDDAIQFICTEILKNSNVYSLMMDSDALISKDITSSSIQKDAQYITKLDGTDFEDKAEHIAHCKDVEIVCLEDCKNRFKKEGNLI